MQEIPTLKSGDIWAEAAASLKKEIIQNPMYNRAAMV